MISFVRGNVDCTKPNSEALRIVLKDEKLEEDRL